MSDWYALFYPLTAGSEETVKELFRHSGRPKFDVTDGDGNQVGRLLSTLAFVGVEKAIRVIEVEGPLPLVAAHMSRQEEVRAFERELEPYLSVPRDMTTPEGARAFFGEAAMPLVVSLGSVPDEDWPKTNWQGIFYPLKPGTEEKVAELFSGTEGGGTLDLNVLDEEGNKVGRLLRTMAFIGNGRALRINQLEGTVEAAIAHLSRQPSAHAFQSELNQYLAVDRDMSDPAAIGAFFMTAITECVLVRRHDQEL